MPKYFGTSSCKTCWVWSWCGRFWNSWNSIEVQENIWRYSCLPVKLLLFAIKRKCSKIMLSKDIDFDIFYIYPTILGANIWRLRRNLGPCKYSFSALCSALVCSFAAGLCLCLTSTKMLFLYHVWFAPHGFSFKNQNGNVKVSQVISGWVGGIYSPTHFDNPKFSVIYWQITPLEN